MIDLEKNGKIATGVKSKNIYKPNQTEDFKISRSKFDNFLTCQRCFYLDVVKGFKEPGTPGWALNSRTDGLLKKEFDKCREKKLSHPFLIKKKLDHIIPYNNKNIAKNYKDEVIRYYKTKKPYSCIDAWRTNSHGLQYKIKDTNIILYGSVDDIWLNTKNNELIVVDYKSQAKDEEVKQDKYFDDEYKSGYQTQIDIYAYLLSKQNLENVVCKYGYLYVVNARGLEEEFDNKIIFEPALIKVNIDNDYLEDKIQQMINLINSKNLPKPNKSCKNCAYARQRSKTDRAG